MGDQEMLAGLAFGAHGVATSLMNYMPTARDVVRLFELGKRDEAFVAQAKIGDAGALIWYGTLASQGITAEKSLMKMVGMDMGPPRLPQLGLERFPAAYTDLKAKLESLGVLDRPDASPIAV